jgi:NAD-dependent dihydropyrimidine dehydrogenase PreA subunit
VLGTLVTDVELEPTPPLDLDCGECRLCIDACPTGALDEPGTLDSTRCLSYWTQAPAPPPAEYRADLGPQVYGCDICQDVCPWNRGVEKRREGEPLPEDATPHVSLVDWLAATRTSCGTASGVFTCRATTAAGSGSMRSSRQATWVATANGTPCPPISTTPTRRPASWRPGRWRGMESRDA